MVERFSGLDMSPRVPAVILMVLALLAASPSARVRAAGLYPEGTDWSPTGDNEALNATARINATSVEGAFSLTDGMDTRNGSSFAWTHSSVPPWTSAATPLAALSPLTAYTVRRAP